MYVVIGANGYLGSYIVRHILQTTDAQVLATCRDLSARFCEHERLRWLEFDLEDTDTWQNLISAMEVSEETCDVVMLAAYHHPDAVQKNPNLAYHINVEQLNTLLERLPNIGSLVYPSTDSVYGESVNGYHFRENDALQPVNLYGQQKAQAEQVVLAHGQHVVRLPFLIGPSLLPHKRHFYDVIVEHIQTKTPIELFCDSLRSSLDFGTVAALLTALLQKETFPQLLNLSGDDDLSKYDVGRMIAKTLKANAAFVRPVSITIDTTIFETARAQSTLMDNRLAKQVLGVDSIKISI